MKTIAFAFNAYALPKQLETLYGANRAVHELSSYFIRHGHQVKFFGLGEAELTFWGDAPISSSVSIQDHAAAIRDAKPDILIGVSTARIFAHVQARKNVVYHHNPTCIEGIGELGRELYAHLQAIVMVSEDAKQRQITYGAPERKLQVVPNGMDPAIFYPDQLTVRSPHRIVFAGTIIDYKGLDLALSAFAGVRQQYPDAELHVYGENKLYGVTVAAKTGAKWMESNGLLNENGFVDWPVVECRFPGVKYFGGVTNEILAGAYRAASVLVSGSLIPETFGLVSIEAQACGCIPVVPNLGGLPETIIEGQTGATYAAGQAESCTNTILDLFQVQQNNELKTWRSRAVEHVHQNFSWKMVGESFERVISESSDHGPANWLKAGAWRLRRNLKKSVAAAVVRSETSST